MPAHRPLSSRDKGLLLMLGMAIVPVIVAGLVVIITHS